MVVQVKRQDRMTNQTEETQFGMCRSRAHNLYKI